jgi:Xaa-Pro aminopeptidase
LLLGELIAGKRIAVDRPYPNLPMINERLRTELRPLSAYEAERLAALGRDVAHALEAAARSCQPGETEADVAGQIAHRLMKHGITPDCLSIAANGRGEKYRRLGFTSHVIQTSATLQATASRDGLHATTSRTVHFGPPTAEFRKAFDDACKLAAVYRSMSKPEESMATAAEAGRWLLANGPHEYEWRRSSPGYGTGRLAAEELRRMGQDEPFGPDQALVWQARIGPAAVVDTVLVTSTGPLAITPPEQWPFKRIRLKEIVNDIPDLLIR